MPCSRTKASQACFSPSWTIAGAYVQGSSPVLQVYSGSVSEPFCTIGLKEGRGTDVTRKPWPGTESSIWDQRKLKPSYGSFSDSQRCLRPEIMSSAEVFQSNILTVLEAVLENMKVPGTNTAHMLEFIPFLKCQGHWVTMWYSYGSMAHSGSFTFHWKVKNM